MKKIQNNIAKFFLITLVLPATALPALADWAQRQKITSTPRGVGAQFGNAVAISGNTMVVGARHDSTTASQAGAAFVYILNGGVWTQQAVLLAGDGAAVDKFGSSVAISGDTIVVGAYQDDAGFADSGSAYVFVRSGTVWSFQQKLTPMLAAAAEEFGNAVAVEGDSIIVGAHFTDLPSNSDAGAAYYYRRNGLIWTETQKLTPTGMFIGGNNFGESIAMSGGKAAIGASGDPGPETAAGAVYVFVESGGFYGIQQKLNISNGTNGDRFGSSVAIEGNTLVGGAREDAPVVGQTARGSAYVFEFNGSNWVSQGQLLGSDGASFDRFGWSVAVSNNVIAVGAREDDTTVGADAGSAYVFTRNGAGWNETQKLAPTDPFNSDRFGSSVALSDGRLIVGAAEKALTAPNGQGAVYYFTNPKRTLFDFDGDGRGDVSVFRPADGVWYLLQSQTGFTAAQFGISNDAIVPADYDGDGKTDLAVYRSGTWYILRSSLGFSAVNFGLNTDIPVPADYTGDGKADIAVWRPGSGRWYVLRSDDSNTNYLVVDFGANGDKPVTADFDGDGKSDYAVYRPAVGTWYLNRSTLGFMAAAWGINTDKPVAADYSGDGKADIAVWRPDSGTWYVLRGENSSQITVQFGANGDKPVAADYDGDGKADYAVYRDGVWYQLLSQSGFQSVQFGIASDKPIPNAYIP